MVTERRPRWWTELLLILVVYGLYSLIRLFAGGAVGNAVDNAVTILRFERLFGVDFESTLNGLFTHNPWIGIPADFAYAALHYLATPVLLFWVFHRHRDRYRELRTWLLSSTLIGLIGFVLVPTAPPRLLHPGHGFIDTMAAYSHWGWWGDEASAPRGLGGLTNQYAAMPSLHVGWALWCGVVLWQLGRRAPWVRGLAVAYPVAITLIVMGTANHYFLDAVAGVAVMGAGLLLTPGLRRFSRRIRRIPDLSADATHVEQPTADGVFARAAGAAEAAHASGTATAVSDGCETAAAAGTTTSREARPDAHATRAHPPLAPASARSAGRQGGRDR